MAITQNTCYSWAHLNLWVIKGGTLWWHHKVLKRCYGWIFICYGCSKNEWQPWWLVQLLQIYFDHLLLIFIRWWHWFAAVFQMPVEYRSVRFHLHEDILSSFLIVHVSFSKKSLHRKMQNYKSTMQLICLERNIVIQVKHYAEYIKVKILTAH